MTGVNWTWTWQTSFDMSSTLFMFTSWPQWHINGSCQGTNHSPLATTYHPERPAVLPGLFQLPFHTSETTTFALYSFLLSVPSCGLWINYLAWTKFELENNCFIMTIVFNRVVTVSEKPVWSDDELFYRLCHFPFLLVNSFLNEVPLF